MKIVKNNKNTMTVKEVLDFINSHGYNPLHHLQLNEQDEQDTEANADRVEGLIDSMITTGKLWDVPHEAILMILKQLETSVGDEQQSINDPGCLTAIWDNVDLLMRNAAITLLLYNVVFSPDFRAGIQNSRSFLGNGARTFINGVLERTKNLTAKKGIPMALVTRGELKETARLIMSGVVKAKDFGSLKQFLNAQKGVRGVIRSAGFWSFVGTGGLAGILWAGKSMGIFDGEGGSGIMMTILEGASTITTVLETGAKVGAKDFVYANVKGEGDQSVLDLCNISSTIGVLATAVAVQKIGRAGARKVGAEGLLFSRSMVNAELKLIRRGVLQAIREEIGPSLLARYSAYLNRAKDAIVNQINSGQIKGLSPQFVEDFYTILQRRADDALTGGELADPAAYQQALKELGERYADDIVANPNAYDDFMRASTEEARTMRNILARDLQTDLAGNGFMGLLRGKGSQALLAFKRMFGGVSKKVPEKEEAVKRALGIQKSIDSNLEEAFVREISSGNDAFLKYIVTGGSTSSSSRIRSAAAEAKGIFSSLVGSTNKSDLLDTQQVADIVELVASRSGAEAKVVANQIKNLIFLSHKGGVKSADELTVFFNNLIKDLDDETIEFLAEKGAKLGEKGMKSNFTGTLKKLIEARLIPSRNAASRSSDDALQEGAEAVQELVEATNRVVPDAFDEYYRHFLKLAEKTSSVSKTKLGLAYAATELAGLYFFDQTLLGMLYSLGIVSYHSMTSDRFFKLTAEKSDGPMSEAIKEVYNTETGDRVIINTILSYLKERAEQNDTDLEKEIRTALGLFLFENANEAGRYLGYRRNPNNKNLPQDNASKRMRRLLATGGKYSVHSIINEFAKARKSQFNNYISRMITAKDAEGNIQFPDISSSVVAFDENNEMNPEYNRVLNFLLINVYLLNTELPQRIREWKSSSPDGSIRLTLDMDLFVLTDGDVKGVLNYLKFLDLNRPEAPQLPDLDDTEFDDQGRAIIDPEPDVEIPDKTVSTDYRSKRAELTKLKTQLRDLNKNAPPKPLETGTIDFAYRNYQQDLEDLKNRIKTVEQELKKMSIEGPLQEKKYTRENVENLVLEMLKEFSYGQGYNPYPYHSEIGNQEEEAEDFIQDWKDFELALVRDETKNTAIEVAKILVKDLELFGDVLDLVGKNQSVATEILKYMRKNEQKS